jgi:hypothetical protein
MEVRRCAQANPPLLFSIAPFLFDHTKQATQSNRVSGRVLSLFAKLDAQQYRVANRNRDLKLLGKTQSIDCLICDDCLG